MVTKYIFAEAPYGIKDGAKADAQTIGEELEKISEANDGRLQPRAVWLACKDKPRHPLYRHFYWDVQEAAEKYWDIQARDLIRIVRLKSADTESGSARAFLSISDDAGVSYRTLKEVKGSRALQTIVLQQAERDLLAFEVRYRELVDVCKLVREARDVISKKRGDLEDRPT